MKSDIFDFMFTCFVFACLVMSGWLLGMIAMRGCAMKVKVTTERDCCHVQEDLQTYRGQSRIPDVLKPKFCKHCGQLWYLSRFIDAAGLSDSEYVRCVPDHHAAK